MNNNIDISKRTKGEWNTGSLGFGVKDDKGSLIAECDQSFRSPYECEANAAFIVLACNNYDKLTDLLSRIVGSMALERVERFDLNNEAKQLLQSLETI